MSFDCLPVNLALFPDLFSDTKAGSSPEELYGAVEMGDPDKLRRLHFHAASEFWLATKKPYLKERSFYNLQSNVRQLNVSFGEMIVRSIHIGHIREHHEDRATNAKKLWDRPAGPSIINHEIVALQGVLTLADEWKKIKPYYKPLPLPAKQKPKVMSDEQEIELFAITETMPECRLGFWVASISINTGAGGAELRNVRLGELRLDSRLPGFFVNAATAKNQYRGRWVPLNPTGLKHMRCCLERAKACGSTEPDHYLFPLRRTTNKWNPTKPASPSWLRKVWPLMMKAAGLKGITPHCMRHQHATISLEAGESEFNVAKRLGHRNPTMLREVYGHLRPDTQASGVYAIDPTVRFGPKVVGIDDKMRRIK